jgi:hypothetical protein
VQALLAERAGLDGAAIDEADLRAALARFDEVWTALDLAERARALQLLIERIVFDGRVAPPECPEGGAPPASRRASPELRLQLRSARFLPTRWSGVFVPVRFHPLLLAEAVGPS